MQVKICSIFITTKYKRYDNFLGLTVKL